jgi:PTS system N-acetylglucosamine-specific IIC component
MFLAPLLYAIHALLTGISMSLMDWLGVHLGFGFSAGLFDYVLNFSKSTRPWLLIPVGVGYFALYYGLFSYFIRRFDLKTLGREAEEAAPRAEAGAGTVPAFAWINALGSATNLRVVEACTTRLRLVLADPGRIDERELKALGSRGVLRLADGAVQVVVGPVADQLASEIREGLRQVGAGVSATPAANSTPATVERATPADATRLAAAVSALGGRGNIVDLHLGSSRLCVSLRDPGVVNEVALSKVVRAVARPAPGSVHLVLGSEAPSWFAELKGS